MISFFHLLSLNKYLDRKQQQQKYADKVEFQGNDFRGNVDFLCVEENRLELQVVADCGGDGPKIECNDTCCICV